VKQSTYLALLFEFDLEVIEVSSVSLNFGTVEGLCKPFQKGKEKGGRGKVGVSDSLPFLLMERDRM